MSREDLAEAILCHCRWLRLEDVRRALAAGAKTFAEVAALCADAGPPEAQGGGQPRPCGTARQAGEKSPEGKP